MLDEFFKALNNWFVVEDGVKRGRFSISSGALVVGFLKTGQYFRIVGSVMNDGVYKYPVTGLTDEEFEGEVWAMAVPPAVVALISEISSWVEKYGESSLSPYQSESFGGYSYSKGSSGKLSGASSSLEWQSVFGSRLSRWRKI